MEAQHACSLTAQELRWLPLALLCTPPLFIASFLDSLTCYWMLIGRQLHVNDRASAKANIIQSPLIVLLLPLLFLIVSAKALQGPRSWPRLLLTSYRIDFGVVRLFFSLRALRWLPWASDSVKAHAFASYCAPPSLWCGLLGLRSVDDTDAESDGLRLLAYLQSSSNKLNGWRAFCTRCPQPSGRWPRKLVDARDATGATALFHVFNSILEEESVEIAQCMLELGFDVNAQDRRGNTPIHNGRRVPVRRQVVQHIVQSHEYDWNRTNERGETAAMYWSGVSQRVSDLADEGKDVLQDLMQRGITRQYAGHLADTLRSERAKLLEPTLGEVALEQRLREAAEADALHRVPLYDMLWDEPDDAIRRGRLLHLFGVIEQLVRACHEYDGVPLSEPRKRLLKFLMTITMGPATAEDDPRAPYRQRMSAMFGRAMAEFGAKLSREYEEMLEAAAAAGATAPVPAPEDAAAMDVTTAAAAAASAASASAACACAALVELPDETFVPRRLVHQCPAGLGWARARSLRGAYHALLGGGVVTGISDFSQLLATGRSRMMDRPHPDLFHNAYSWQMWAALVALSLLGECARALPAFSAACASLSTQFEGAEWNVGNIKLFERTWVKTLEYIGDHTKAIVSEAEKVAASGFVIDMLRGSITVRTVPDAVRLCAAIEGCGAWQVLKRKNGFRKQAEAIGGYRDIKYVVRLLEHARPPTKPASRPRRAPARAVTPETRCEAAAAADVSTHAGPTGEIQVVLQSTSEVKKKMHAIYTAWRGDFDHERWRK